MAHSRHTAMSCSEGTNTVLQIWPSSRLCCTPDHVSKHHIPPFTHLISDRILIELHVVDLRNELSMTEAKHLNWNAIGRFWKVDRNSFHHVPMSFPYNLSMIWWRAKHSLSPCTSHAHCDNHHTPQKKRVVYLSFFLLAPLTLAVPLRVFCLFLRCLPVSHQN